jgi:hypothetical protein
VVQGKGLGNCARQLLKEVATVRSMDVVLPVKPAGEERATELRLRVVARPDRMVAELLCRLGLDLPSVPKIVQNVVPKNAPQIKGVFLYFASGFRGRAGGVGLKGAAGIDVTGGKMRVRAGPVCSCGLASPRVRGITCPVGGRPPLPS